MRGTELPYCFSPKKTNLNSWHTTTSAMTIDKYKTNIKYQSQAIFGQYVKKHRCYGTAYKGIHPELYYAS